MKSKFKNGFTMIELIFVIVILGILASVAVPKLLSTKSSAEAQKIESFLGTMNRTTLPTMYSSAVRDGGSITAFSIDDFTSIPISLGVVDISACGSGTFETVATSDVGIVIYCRDGNSTNMPLFSFSNTDFNATLSSKYFK